MREPRSNNSFGRERERERGKERGREGAEKGGRKAGTHRGGGGRWERKRDVVHARNHGCGGAPSDSKNSPKERLSTVSSREGEEEEEGEEEKEEDEEEKEEEEQVGGDGE